MHLTRSIWLLSLGLLLAWGCQPAGPATSATGPNIVFILTDDLGYGDLGCFGATDIATPHLDRIASEGLKLSAHYTSSPVCSPSRAGLLTGRHPQRMGINGVFFPDSYTGMSPEEVTIAEVLREKGYATGCVGKWHLGHRERYLPLNQGFDSYYGIPYSNDMQSVVYLRDNEVDSFQVNQAYTTRVYTEKALAFIEAHRAQPFFLYVAHNMPHVPIYASPDFLGTSQRGLYGDVIQEIDWSVGQIMAKLEALGLAENTLLVFSSDNGPWLVMEDHGGSAGPLREGKQYTFEGGMRVPTLAWWPGTIAPAEYGDMTLQLDWFPTFAQLAGAAIPSDRPYDGEDISPLLREGQPRQGDRYLYFDAAEHDLQAYRAGDWKLKLPYPGYAGSRGKKAVAAHDTLLFNLREDIGERQNLAGQAPDKLREMVQGLTQARDAMGPLPPSLILRSPADNSHYEYLRQKHAAPAP